MAAFSHQQHPLLLDSVFSPNSPLKNSGFLDEFFPNWTQFCPSIPLPQGSSMDASNQESSCIEQQSINSMAEKQGKQSLSTTSMADKAESGEQVTQICSPDDKKRKSRNGSSSNSANSKDVKQARGKKQKGDKEAKKEEKNDKDQNKAKNEEPPKGYIHVRARRGQATDSHSLAERVRREKISERMKMLQALVPGCDKVTGKALMLDEIINYVQSLQNQVEFLSMRLASLDPMVYNFGLMELDPIMPFGVQGVINNDGMALSMTPMTMSSSSAIVNATSNISSAPSANFSDVNATAGVSPNKPINLPNANPLSTTMARTTFPSPNGVDGSNNLFQLGQKPSVLIPQDRSVYLGSGVDDQQRLSFFNQFGFGANN